MFVAKSLRARLLIVLVTFTALPLLLISILTYRSARDTIEGRTVAQLTSIADIEVEQLERWLDARKADVQIISDNFLNEEHFTEILDPSVDQARREAFAGFLTDNLLSIQKARDGYEEIVFVDAEGTVRIATDADRVGESILSEPAVRRTLASPTDTHVEDIYRAPSGELEMAFGATLHRVDLATREVTPEINGAVVIRVRMEDTVYPLIRTWPGMGSSGEMLLVRGAGDETLFLNPLRFMEDAPLEFSVSRDSSKAQPAHYATAGKEGVTTTVDYRGVTVIAAYRYLPGIGWGFVAKQDAREALAPVRLLTRQWIVLAVVVVLAAYLAAILLARALTQPLSRLMERATAVERGNFESGAPVEGPREVRLLSGAFETMTSAVRERESQLKAHAEELEVLNELGRNIAATLELADIANRVVHIVADRFGRHLAVLFLRDEDQEELVAYATAGTRADMVSPLERISKGRGVIGRAAEERRTQVVSDAKNIAHFEALPGLDTKSEVAVPVLREGRLLGVLVVDSNQEAAFTHDDQMFLETLAAQLAPAIENAGLFRDLSASYDHTLDALVAALDARDKETEGHSRRVVAYTLEIAQQLEVDAKDLATIRRGALLHDIGKIGVPDSILLKPGPLNDEERAVMMRHPELGRQILAGIPFLKDPVEIVCAHQERYDGAGYPEGLAGSDIPFGARIFAVADTLDAITSDRPYRAGRPYEVAREEIVAHSGSQFDPQVVEAFLSVDSARWDQLRHEAMTIAAGESAFPLWQQSATGGIQLELDAINRLVARVSGFSDLDQALHSAARASVESFGAASCGVFLREDGDGELVLKAHYLLPEPVRRELGRFPLDGTHCEAVMQEQTNRVYDDLVDVSDFVEIGLPQERPDLGAYLCVPVVAGGESEGILALFSRRPHSFDSHDMSVFRTLADAVGLAVENARIAGASEPVAREIPVVGDRSELVSLVADAAAADFAQGSTTGLLLIDIDNFALYNETFGTTAGDEALHHIGELLRRSVRSYDRIVSYGGGAFAVVLRQTDLGGAKIVAEKMRLGVESLQLPYGALTSSLGLSTTTHNPQPTALLTAAERALSSAKEDGRNCVRAWTEAV